MALFGRRKPGFSKEVPLNELDLSGEFSDQNDPAMTRNSNPKEEKTAMAEKAQKVMNGELYKETVENESNEAKIDIFEYMESLPEVEDPFPPSDPEIDREPEPELKPGEILAEFIRERTRATEITSKKALLKEDDQMEEMMKEMGMLESCADIQTVKGNKDEYYYSGEIMAKNYAMIAMLVKEKNIPVTITHMVTFNCKTYPSPTPLYYFNRSPYLYSVEQIEEAVRLIEADPEKKNIKTVKADNGQIYLYDENVMSYKYARALANDGEAGEADY